MKKFISFNHNIILEDSQNIHRQLICVVNRIMLLILIELWKPFTKWKLILCSTH